MAYVNPNFKSKKALKEAIKDGKTVEVFQPGLGTVPMDGTIALEGPHYPEPHKWYAVGTMKNGKLVEVK
jgi:hypothetical protein